MIYFGFFYLFSSSSDCGVLFLYWLLLICYDGASVFDDSDDKTYLIRQIYHFKLRSLVYCKTIIF